MSEKSPESRVQSPESARLAEIAAALEGKPIIFARRALIKLLGLHKAIILQQLVWLTDVQAETAAANSLEMQGWIRGGMKRWQRLIPGLCRETIEKALDELLELGVLERQQPGGDGTPFCWRIDVQAFALICSDAIEADKPNLPKNQQVPNLLENQQVPVGKPAGTCRKTSRSDGRYKVLRTLKNSKDSADNDDEQSRSSHQNLLPLAGEDAGPSTAKKKITGGDACATGKAPRSKYTAEDLATAEAYIAEVERLREGGMTCVSRRSAPSLAAAVAKAWPRYEGRGRTAIPLQGPPYDELHKALVELGAQPYWAKRYLMMAQFTRPATWLDLHAEWQKRHVPLPRATGAAPEGTEMRPLEEEN